MSHNHSHSHGHGGHQCSHDHGSQEKNSITAQPAAPVSLSNTIFADSGVAAGADTVTTAPGGARPATSLQEPYIIARQLTVALRVRHVATVKSLISRLETLKSLHLLKEPDDEGHSLMHWAAMSGYVEMMSALYNAGCPVEVQSTASAGMYPIHWACTIDSIASVKWLINNGADVNCRDRQGCTPLTIAAQNGLVGHVLFLVKHGANVSILDNNEDSALHWAAYKGNDAVLITLLKMGQSISASDVFGHTPLHLAAIRGNLDAVEYLVLEAKADMTIKDKKGLTPLDLSIEKKKPQVEFFLRSHAKGGAWNRAMLVECIKRPSIINAMCRTGYGVEGSYFPFLLNLVSSTGVGVVTFLRFFDDTFLESTPRLYLVVAATTMYVLSWIGLAFVYFSDPGYLSKEKDVRFAGLFNSRLACIENGDVDEEAEGDKTRFRGQMCYTCHIERPIRSKHCRVCRKCVRCFDHHCPFVSTCVGGQNYGKFMLYVVLFLSAASTHVAGCITYMTALHFDYLCLASTIYCIGFIMVISGLFVYHSNLIYVNLTTNEHQNWSRYRYLLSPSGTFLNPFNQSCTENCMSRTVWGNADVLPRSVIRELTQEHDSERQSLMSESNAGRENTEEQGIEMA